MKRVHLIFGENITAGNMRQILEKEKGSFTVVIEEGCGKQEIMRVLEEKPIKYDITEVQTYVVFGDNSDDAKKIALSQVVAAMKMSQNMLFVVTQSTATAIILMLRAKKFGTASVEQGKWMCPLDEAVLAQYLSESVKA